MTRSATRIGITWSGREALRGVSARCRRAGAAGRRRQPRRVPCARDAAGCGARGSGGTPRRRPRLFVVGAAFAASTRPAARSAGSRWRRRLAVRAGLRRRADRGSPAGGPRAAALPSPAFALGMNEPCRTASRWRRCSSRAARATLVAVCAPVAPRPAQARPRATSGRSASTRCFATAARLGLALGHLLDVAHVAWASAAALFIMRPDPALLASRAWRGAGDLRRRAGRGAHLPPGRGRARAGGDLRRGGRVDPRGPPEPVVRDPGRDRAARRPDERRVEHRAVLDHPARPAGQYCCCAPVLAFGAGAVPRQRPPAIAASIFAWT